MSKQTPNRELPEDIKPTINGLRALAFTELRNGNYKAAEKIYLRELTIINRKEKEREASIHKGATYYNLGLSRILQNNPKSASEAILLAYIEDLFNVQVGNEQEANKAPAREMLSRLFGITDVTLEPLKEFVKEFKREPERWKKASPTELFKKFGKQILQKAKTPAFTRPPIDTIEQGTFPDRRRSVFIGGPFKISAYLKELRKLFLRVRPRYSPFMSTDFTFKKEETHDSCMKILSSCGHAIFDVSTEAGQYAEIEHAKIKNIPTLLVFSAMNEEAKKNPPFSAIIKTVGFRIEGFCYLDELEEIFKEFLPEEPE